MNNLASYGSDSGSDAEEEFIEPSIATAKDVPATQALEHCNAPLIAPKLNSGMEKIENIPIVQLTQKLFVNAKRCEDTEVINRLNNYSKTKDFDMISNITSKKEFSNPYILLKIVDYFNINQFGSNIPNEIFDSNEHLEEDNIDNITIKMNSSDSSCNLVSLANNTITNPSVTNQGGQNTNVSMPSHPTLLGKRKSRFDSLTTS